MNTLNENELMEISGGAGGPGGAPIFPLEPLGKVADPRQVDS